MSPALKEIARSAAPLLMEQLAELDSCRGYWISKGFKRFGNGILREDVAFTHDGKRWIGLDAKRNNVTSDPFLNLALKRVH